MMGVARAEFDATVSEAIAKGTQHDLNKLLQPLAARPNDLPDHAVVLDAAAGTLSTVSKTAKRVVMTLVDLCEAHLTEIRLLTVPELIPDRIAFLTRLVAIARAHGQTAAVEYARVVRSSRLRRKEVAESVPARALDVYLPSVFHAACLMQHSSPEAAGDTTSPRTAAGHRTGRPQPCNDWNRGNCTRAGQCKYVHMCSQCSSYGHTRTSCSAAPPTASRTKPRNVTQRNKKGDDKPVQSTPGGPPALED